MIRATSLDHLRFTFTQRPWSLYALPLLGMGLNLAALLGLAAMNAGLQGDVLGVLFGAALVVGALPGALADQGQREATVEIHDARVRLRGWLGRWWVRSRQIDVSMVGLELSWEAAGTGLYHLLFRSADGTIRLPSVSCRLEAIVALQEALRERMDGSRDRIGSRSEVPRDLQALAGRAEEVAD